MKNQARPARSTVTTRSKRKRTACINASDVERVILNTFSPYVLAFKPQGGPIHHSWDLLDRVDPVFSLASQSLPHFDKLFAPKDLWALGRTHIRVQKLSKYLDEYPDVRLACFLAIEGITTVEITSTPHSGIMISLCPFLFLKNQKSNTFLNLFIDKKT